MNIPRTKSNETRDAEILGEIAIDGIYKYGLPALIGCVGGTFLMRRRYASLKATTAERFLLSALHYYAAIIIGLGAGLKLYEPTFEQKVMERIPNSSYAKIIRDKNLEK